MNIILIGYRATGKSTVARRLAARLAWPWIDADHEVESRAGKSIAEIFDDDGEERFRDLESMVLADLAARKRSIIAAGGGAVLREQNRALLRSAGRVVWLQADPDTILLRIQADHENLKRRPNLTASGGKEEIVALLARRNPLYAQCADIALETAGHDAEDTASRIIEQLDLSAWVKPA